MNEPATVLCAGIAVLDQVFRVDRLPSPESKTPARDLVIVSGGCAANAAITVARLGGHARYAGPLGADTIAEQILAAVAREHVATHGVVRVAGAASPLSAVLVDPQGERAIVTYRSPGLADTRPTHPGRLVADIDALLVDNRYPDFVLPICTAARERGLPVILDADAPVPRADPLLQAATHLVFSAEGARGTAATNDLDAALECLAGMTDAFYAITDGANDMRWRGPDGHGRLPAFKVVATDTLAAGDVFHGAFALAIAEGQPAGEAMRFAAAAAALKCTRFGGVTGAPARVEVAALLTSLA